MGIRINQGYIIVSSVHIGESEIDLPRYMGRMGKPLWRN